MGLLTGLQTSAEDFIGRTTANPLTSEDLITKEELGDQFGGPFASFFGEGQLNFTIPATVPVDIFTGWNMIAYTLPYEFNFPSMMLGLFYPELLTTVSDVLAIFPDGLANITSDNHNAIISGHSNSNVNGKSIDILIVEKIGGDGGSGLFKNALGAIYWPEFGFNGIGNAIPGEGYQVKNNSASNYQNLSYFLLGSQIPEVVTPIITDLNSYIENANNNKFNLIVGWSIVGYNRRTPLDAVEAFNTCQFFGFSSNIDDSNTKLNGKLQILKTTNEGEDNTLVLGSIDSQGNSTSFLTDFQVGDTIKFDVNGFKFSRTIKSIISDSVMTLSDIIPNQFFVGQVVTNENAESIGAGSGLTNIFRKDLPNTSGLVNLFPTSYYKKTNLVNETIVHSVIIIKNNFGAIYWPEFGFNGIGDLLSGQGYQIKTVEPIEQFSFKDDDPEEDFNLLQSVTEPIFH